MSLSDGIELEQDGVFDRAASLYRRLLQQATDPQERAEIHLRLAVALREDGEPDDAEESLSEAHKALKDVDAPRLKGLVALEEGQLAEDRMALRAAARQYRIAAELLANSEDEHRATLKLASVQRRRGRYAQSLEQLRALDESALPVELRAELQDELGAALIADGSYDDAVDILRRAVELDTAADSDFAVGRSQLLLAEAHVCRGDRVAARQLLQQAEDVYDAAENKRGLSDYFLLYGRWFEESNDYDNAAKHFRMGLRLDQESKDEVGQARALIRLAAVRGKSGDLAEATEHLEEARSLLSGRDDDDVEMINLLTEEGLLALRLYDFDGAIRIFEQVLRLAEEDGDDRSVALAQRRLATGKRENGDLAAAEVLLLSALPVLERSQDRRAVAEILDDLGELLIEQGRYKDAVIHLERGHEYDQLVGNTGAPKALTFLLLGRAHLQLGHRTQAESFLEKALDEYTASEDDGGVAAARYELGLWAAHEGHYRDAATHFKIALELTTRRTDRAGMVRTGRGLAALYRRQGDLDRAEEYLDQAFQTLGQTTDLPERGLLRLERARLALARGNLPEAEQSATEGKRDLESAGRPVEAATCLRTLAHVALAHRDHEKALDLLEKAREALEGPGDVPGEGPRNIPELDDLYDDLGMIRMQLNELSGARDAINKSLALGEQMGWYHGQGRSHMLLGDIALRDGDLDQAGRHYSDALEAYNNAEDEVGRSECLQRLGDWHGLHERWDDAIRHYKDARRLDQRHRDLRGLAQVSRKLGEVYLQRDQAERAAEALEQAEDFLTSHGLEDAERGHVEFGLARVSQARKDWADAVFHAKKALSIFQRSEMQEKVDEVRHGLIDCYKMLGKPDLALEQMRALGLAHTSMWQSLIEDLHPLISEASRRQFYSQNYEDAARAAFLAVETQTRRLADDPTGDLSKVFAKWLSPEGRGLAGFRSVSALNRFREFALGAFDLVRNPLAHRDVKLTPAQAFSALCVAGIIAEQLEAETDELEFT